MGMAIMIRLPLALLLLTVSVAPGAEPPLVITGDEQKRVDFTLPDAGLPPAPGVANVQVFRATRGDGDGWTYHHHVDMGCWKGRLYLAWDSCKKDEDAGESRELYATSSDGFMWSEPKELFPQGLSTHLRMFFFHASNGRMLAIAGLRLSNDPLTERQKGPVIVREIKDDHSLGDVFLLRAPTEETKRDVPPMFDDAPDKGFVEACNQLLANKPFLEQSDYGLLLGDRRMKWHDSGAWPADEPSRPHFKDRFGKAMSFYHRKDGALVALMKWGWVMVSRDEGETWSAPVRPPTLVAGMAKTWGQRTADGRYLLAYNPSLAERFPLVAVTGDDGITFGGMRVIHGELPPMRYSGLYKGIGPQYVRGISEWSSDGSRDDAATWLAYSMSKEDIWVSRVPMPAEDGATGWNTYSPKWAPVTTAPEADGSTTIVLEDGDPADYARAFRVLDDPARTIDVTFALDSESPGGEHLHLQLEGSRGRRALTLPLAGKSARIRLTADAERGQYSLWDDDRIVAEAKPLGQTVERFERIVFTTGQRPATHAPEQDRPVRPARFRVTGLKLTSAD